MGLEIGFDMKYLFMNGINFTHTRELWD